MATAVSSSGYSPGSGSRRVAGAKGNLDYLDEKGPEKTYEGFNVTRLRQQYLDFAGSKRNEIEEARIARHYFNSDQLTANEVKTLKKRRQPPVVRNKIDRKINGVVGLVERLRQDPKAYPRTPVEQERGGDVIATGVVRYLLEKPNDDEMDWPTTAAECARDGAISGLFGIELRLESGDQAPHSDHALPWFRHQEMTDPDISWGQVDSDTFFYDPRSCRYTFRDARYQGVAKWLDLDECIEMFPEKAEELEGLCTWGGGLETWQQRDREYRWIDSNERRVFLIEHWYRFQSEWHFCFYIGHTVLLRGKSPFMDEKGRTFCRYIMQSVNIDHDLDRFGFVRSMKSLQDEVNARASKGLHLLNVRRAVAEKGAVDDVEEARIEAARPDGWVQVNPGKQVTFDDQKNQIDFQGQLQMLQEAKSEIENFGPNPALIGQGIENKSGRAIALLQQAGIAELGPFILGYRNWKLRVYRGLWNTAQRYWTNERWIRVTDDEQRPAFLELNTQELDQWGRPVLVNQLGALDVDILLDEGPDTITMMQDVYDTLIALAQNGLQVPPEILLELAPIPGATKRTVTAKLNELKQQSAPPPEMQQLQMRGAAATVSKTESEAEKNRAAARATMVKLPSESKKNTAGAAQSAARAFSDVVGAMHSIHGPANQGDVYKPDEGGLSSVPPRFLQ